MIAKTYEWLRVAHPQNPSSDIVTARSTTVGKLLDTLRKSNDVDSLAHLCTAAILGLHGRYADDSVLVNMLVASIRADQAAFPSSVQENGLELQAVAALTIGELLAKPEDDEPALSDIAAAMLVALTECRPSTTLLHLANVHAELTDLARKRLETSALDARRRIPLSSESLESLGETPSDIATLWKSVQQAFSELISAFQQESAKDREELELLWWMFNGFSDKLAKSIKELTVETAAIACGVELARRTLLPPSNAVASMAEEMTTRQRAARQLVDVPFEHTLAKWKNGISEVLIPETDQSQHFAKSQPTIFPLTWIALRLKDSQGAPKWQDEFTTKTGWDRATKIPHGRLARQALFEHSCLRMVELHAVEVEE